MSFPVRQPGGFSVGAKVASATWFNPVDNDHSLAASEAQLWASALGLWSGLGAAATIGPSGSDTWAAFAWDATNARWLAWLNDPGGPAVRIYDSLDGGRTWNSTITISAAAACIAAATNAGTTVHVVSNGTGSVASAYGVDTSLTSHFFAWSQPATLGVGWFNVAANRFNFYSATQNGATFTNGQLTATSTTATIVSIGGPAAFNNGTNHLGQFQVASNATTAVVALCGATPVTDSSHLMTVTWNGTTEVMTDITPAVLTNKIVTGVAWDAVDSLWGLLTYDGTNSVLYTSPDLTNWTAVHTFSSTKCVGLAVVGNAMSVWVVGVPFANSVIHSSIRIMASGDVVSYAYTGNTVNTSSTWHWMPFNMPALNNLYGNGAQLLAGSTANAAISAQVALP